MQFKAMVIALFGLSGIGLAGGGEGGHSGHPSHSHHLAVLGGATIHGSHAYPTAGMDYEFFYHAKGGVVAMAEWVYADHTGQIYGLGLAYHPIPQLKTAVIPAWEMSDGHSAFLLRGNLEYGIHLGSLSVAPSVSLDYVSSEVLLVMGLALGMGF